MTDLILYYATDPAEIVEPDAVDNETVAVRAELKTQARAISPHLFPPRPHLALTSPSPRPHLASPRLTSPLPVTVYWMRAREA